MDGRQATTDFAGATFHGATAEENGMRIITVVMKLTDGQKDFARKRFC